MIVLVGFMGAGKTTIGNLLAARLGLPFADSDEVIERRAGRPIKQIFAEDGEPAFRALEHQVIAELLDGPALVLALGGGAAQHPQTQARLTRGDDPPRPPRSSFRGDPSPRTPLGKDLSPRTSLEVVYLEVGYEQAVRRVGGDTGRPMLARSDLPELYRSRLLAYAGVATLTVATDDRHPEVISEDILIRLAAEPVPGGRAPSLRPAP